MPSVYGVVPADGHPTYDSWVEEHAKHLWVTMNVSPADYRGVWRTGKGDEVHLFSDDAAMRSATEDLAPVRPQSPKSRTPMLDAVQADLREIDVDKVQGGRTYQATALWLAQVIDKRGADEGPSTTAKLADQLTKVMQALTRKGVDGEKDDFREFTEAISEPSAG